MSEENKNFEINNLKDVQVFSTNLKFRTASVRWIISDYDILSKIKKEIKSPEFYEIPAENKKRKWHIEIFSDEKTEIWFCRNTSDDIFLEASLTLESLSDGKIIHQPTSFKNILHVGNNLQWLVVQEVFTKNLLLSEPASTKSFIINAIIRVSDTTETICKGLSMKHFDSNNLNQDIYTFFRNDQSFHDVTITAQGKAFKAHKTIIAARSEVLASMLSNEMLEKINSSIEIKDLSPETVEKMLSFIYTDEVDDPDLKQSAAELLDAAERYNLQNLKKMCIAAMQTNLAVDNVLKTLQVADIYSISDLKKVALRFLVAHRQVIKNKNQDEFKFLFAERPNLLLEFVDSLDEIPDNSGC